MEVRKKRHYYVIAGSTVGHLALLFVFSQIALNRVAGEEQAPDARKSTPARVSFEELPYVPPGFPQSQAAGSSQTIMPETDLQQNPAQSTPANVNNQDALATQNAQQAPTEATTAAETEEMGATNSQELPTNYARHGEEVARPKKKKRKYSGAAFMNAFQHAVTSHREADSADRNARYTNTGSNGYDVPVHVQERLAGWRDLNFREKIRYALLKQACTARKVVYGPIKIAFTTLITIDEQGRLTKKPVIDTGSRDMNEYLKEMIENADFPTIPKRFNTKEWAEPFSFDLNMAAGMNTSQLYLAPGASPNSPLRIY